MKTRPIHNNAHKWAKQKVTLIVDWIRTGGKNNKETIDRIEKRLRDHFRQNAHTKNKEENEKKGQYSIFHNETNSSE